MKSEKNWLFYSDVRVLRNTSSHARLAHETRITMGLPTEKGSVNQVERGTSTENLYPASELQPQPVYYVVANVQAEQELYSLSVLSDASFSSRDERGTAALLQWHERLGHRNFRDVSSATGIPLPAKLPTCVTCIQAKSKRHPLTTRGLCLCMGSQRPPQSKNMGRQHVPQCQSVFEFQKDIR